MPEINPKEPYPKAPIVEAVFEVRFAETLSIADFARARERFKSNYPKTEDENDIRVAIDGPHINTQTSLSGIKLTASNAADIVLIRTNLISSNRYAPYIGWDDFFSKVISNFETFTKLFGRKTITRIGTRFLNRLDIPSEQLEGRSVSEWVKATVALPKQLTQTIGPYSFAVNFIHLDTGAKILLQSGVVPPALLKHVSVTLDIDAFVDENIGPHKDEIKRIAPMLRAAKNSVFENLITEKLRMTFS